MKNHRQVVRHVDDTKMDSLSCVLFFIIADKREESFTGHYSSNNIISNNLVSRPTAQLMIDTVLCNGITKPLELQWHMIASENGAHYLEEL